MQIPLISPLNANTADPRSYVPFPSQNITTKRMYHLLELLRVLRSDDSLPGSHVNSHSERSKVIENTHLSWCSRCKYNCFRLYNCSCPSDPSFSSGQGSLPKQSIRLRRPQVHRRRCSSSPFGAATGPVRTRYVLLRRRHRRQRHGVNAAPQCKCSLAAFVSGPDR